MIGKYKYKLEGENGKRILTRVKDFAEQHIADGMDEEEAYRRTSCEIPEMVVAIECIDFELNKFSHKDPYDGTYNERKCDFKQYAKSGIHVGPHPQRWVKEGKIQDFVIWKWLPNNFYAGRWSERFTLGSTVEFEILGIVDAKEALQTLEENRFKYD